MRYCLYYKLSMKKQLTLLCLFILVFSSVVNAQKTVEFNGKTYLVYPQIIENGYYAYVTFDYRKLSLKTSLPPVIGSIPDGEYVIYKDNYYLKNKRKINKEIVYDTFNYIYATFTIKNNKKEGIASIYRQNEKPIIDIQIPYVNDLIHGKVVVYNKQSYDEKNIYNADRTDLELTSDDLNPSRYDFYNYNGYKRIDYKGFMFVMHFESGMVNGILEKYRYTKKDTLLCDQFQVVNNQRNGQYKQYTYCSKKKQIIRYAFNSGYLVNDRKVGVWKKIKYILNEKEIYHYNVIGISAYLYFADSLTLRTKKLYGKDSVLKYVPDYKSRILFPNLPRYYDKKSIEEIVEFEYRSNKTIDTLFRIGAYTSIGFYNNKWGSDEQKDTIISGGYFRIIKDYNNNIRFYEIDTCSRKEKYHTGYCINLLWTNIYNKDMKLVKHTMTDYYRNKYLVKSSSIYEESVLQNKHITRKNYYYKPLEFKFSNIEYHNGFNMNARVYYKVSGDTVSGSIIKYIKIPLKNDTLVLIDTFMSKGKNLIDYDEFFFAGVGNYISYNNEILKSKWQYFDFFNEGEIAVILDNYFTIKAIQHRAIYIGNKPFTGRFDVFRSYGNNKNSLQVELLERDLYLNGNILQVLEMHFEISKPDYIRHSRVNGYYRLSPLIKSMNFQLSRGRFDGNFLARNIFGYKVSAGIYYKNKLDGNFEWFLYGIGKYIKDKKIKKEDLDELEKSKMNFDNGQKEGQWAMISRNYNNDYRFYLTFHKNKLEGTQYRILKNANFDHISYVFTMQDDTLNGKVWKLDQNGYPSATGNFVKGVPNGEFIEYFPIDTFKFYQEKFRFDNGFLNGRYEQYRDSNNLKFTIDFNKSDSLYFSVFKPMYMTRQSFISSNSSKNTIKTDGISIDKYKSISADLNFMNINGYNFINDLFRNLYIKKGFYTYYYKSGTVFKLGLMEDYLPKGRWKFYREGKDRLYKTIDFKDSVVKLLPNDSIDTFGLVHAYYDDGRLMFKGYATDVSSKYSCDSEADIPTEENYYLEFYDTTGNSTLKDGNGFITELQASGHKLKEGQIQNNKKQGIWIYYNSFGQPEAIGFYNNGKKQGRWLVGDLSGLNLSDNVCFMSNEEFLMWVDTYGKNLSLSEEFYNNGVLVNDNTVKTISR